VSSPWTPRIHSAGEAPAGQQPIGTGFGAAAHLRHRSRIWVRKENNASHRGSLTRVTREVDNVSGSSRGLPTIKGWFRPRKPPSARTPRAHRSDRVPMWTSQVERGSVHDITAERLHVLGGLYPAAVQGLPTLTEKGYTGAAIGSTSRQRGYARPDCHHSDRPPNGRGLRYLTQKSVPDEKRLVGSYSPDSRLPMDRLPTKQPACSACGANTPTGHTNARSSRPRPTVRVSSLGISHSRLRADSRRTSSHGWVPSAGNQCCHSHWNGCAKRHFSSGKGRRSRNRVCAGRWNLAR